MELADAVRILWRHRLIAVLGAPLSVAIALLGTHRVSLSPFRISPPRYSIGIATANVLVDTSSSQLVDLNAMVDEDASTLTMRVRVLTDDMAGDSARAALAREFGAPAAQIAVSPFDTGPTYTTAVAKSVGEVPVDGARPYIVNLSVGASAPIVSINTTAPNAAAASRLAKAARTTFTRLVQSKSRDDGFVATPLGRAQGGQVLVGSRKAITAAVALFAVCLWLFAVIVAGGLVMARASTRTAQVAGP